MNYCRKCQSDYEKPGTCNCFAPVAPREATPPVFVPYTQPVLPLYQPWWVSPWGTVMICTTCGRQNCDGNHATYSDFIVGQQSMTLSYSVGPVTS